MEGTIIISVKVVNKMIPKMLPNFGTSLIWAQMTQ